MAEKPPKVVITGAAGGIGRALVKQFETAGYGVIATDLVERPADLTCFAYLQVDLARTVEDERYASEVFVELRAALDGAVLKALINNAAVQRLGGVESLRRDSWHDSLNVNLLAPFVWTQALLRELERSSGCVVNVSSVHARLTKAGFVAYATSKAALSGLTRAMAVDLGSRVRINAIEPAAIDTPMLRAGFVARDCAFGQLAEAHPIGRIGRTDEVAACALALVNGSAEFLHGACIALDGGISARLMDPG